MNSQPVLIVEDEDDVRDTLLESLSHQGFTVEAVASAEEAVLVLAQRPFAVVVTDMQMPGGQTGLDLIAMVVLWALLGFHWAFLPSFFTEWIPYLNMAPLWTLAVALATRGRSDVQLPEPPPNIKIVS